MVILFLFPSPTGSQVSQTGPERSWTSGPLTFISGARITGRRQSSAQCFVNATQSRVAREERTSVESFSWLDGMSACPRGTHLTGDWCGWAGPAEGDAVSMDKRANRARDGGSNHQAGIPLWFLSSFCVRSYADFPPRWRPESCKLQSTLSAPKLLLVIVFTTAAKKQIRAVAMPASRDAGDRARAWCSAARHP